MGGERMRRGALSALCTGMLYALAASVLGALRTKALSSYRSLLGPPVLVHPLRPPNRRQRPLGPCLPPLSMGCQV
ncbi:hypothetical protein BD626DRAFT_473250 [Schizophyllum amplum]|uniref:Uncharacterized protein n=1 Tax=Schizophyllum amplum TaxID=97359 RepID=A0A550CWN1_9AGAR|nr:hypothetical protein BD626DRAFT_473250 [Auriculariopsis ampla]